VLLAVGLLTPAAWGFFADAFDGPGLDARWVSDNSPTNPLGSDIGIVSGQAVGSGCKENLYNHLETPIEVVEIFEVQVDAQIDQAQNWGAALVVYWDTTHFIVLKAPKNSWFRSEVFDGSSFTMTNSTRLYLGGQMATMRIEFTADTIRFYAKNQSDPDLTHLSGLDIARTAAFDGENALMIIGKGRQDDTTYTSPDYDNDWGFAGADDQIVLDNAIYQGQTACGDSGTVYLRADLNENCYVELGDFLELSSQWLWCTDIGKANCDTYWQGDFGAWQIDPYENFMKDRSQGASDPILERIDVKMAQGEYRDALFMLGPYAETRNINIDVQTSAGVPGDMILVQETLYLLNRAPGGTQYTGDALYPLSGPLTVPAGESRQVRLRFDARYSGVEPNDYKFAVILTDADAGEEQVIPGSLTVWDFELSSYDEFPNNGFVWFNNTQWSGNPNNSYAVKDMKEGGFNIIYIHPIEMPTITSHDENWDNLVLDSTQFENRINMAVNAWAAAPGNDKLKWLIQPLSSVWNGEGSGPPGFLSTQWHTAFGNYLAQIKAILAGYGIYDDDWMMTLADEETAAALMEYTIPMAEAIKSIDSSVTMKCNSSAILIYPSWAARYLAATDIFQPHHTAVEDPTYHASLGGTYLDWLKSSGKPIWSYRCEGHFDEVGEDVYDYYRLDGWRAVKYGLVGTGIWTYCAQGIYPWIDPLPPKPTQSGFILIFQHWDIGNPEVVHSRRYEMFREGRDDYRYVHKLREVAAAIGGSAPADVEQLIDNGATNILTNGSNHALCDQVRVTLAEEILRLQGLLTLPDPNNPQFFEDTFEGYVLNPRWSNDISPTNANEPTFAPHYGAIHLNTSTSGGCARAYPIYTNTYDHLETPIDASGEFAVQADISVTNGISVGALLSVYWDTTHFVSFKAGRNTKYNREIYDGSDFTDIASTKDHDYGVFGTFRIEFWNDTIKFYAKNHGEPALTHLAELDMPRGDFSYPQQARLIVGKGKQILDYGGGVYEQYPNPDYDNDHIAGPGSADESLLIDNVIYERLSPPSCGDPGTKRLETDLNEDCHTDARDLAELARQWFSCTDPANPACDAY